MVQLNKNVNDIRSWLVTPNEQGRHYAYACGTWGAYMEVCSIDTLIRIKNLPHIINEQTPFYTPYTFKNISCWQMLELLKDHKDNLEDWLDACEDLDEEIRRYWMKQRSPKIRLFDALEAFKDYLPKFLRHKKLYDPDGGDWSIIENYLNNENWRDVERARGVSVEAVLDYLNINHKYGRSTTPFDSSSSNKQSFAFKENLYQCFKTGNSGDCIDLVKKLTGKTFYETISFLNTL